MKIAIGTAQFGMEYGINNRNGIPTDVELNEIFNLAIKNEIYTIDTAAGYGNSESRIGQNINQEFKIVSKFSSPDLKIDLSNKLNTTLNNLNLSNLYGYLSHNPNEILEKNNLWDDLLLLKQKNLVKKIGYSLYDTSQLEKLLNLGMIPDLIQIPYSLFDRRFEPYFVELKDLNIEIHTRSVYLQGLYLMETNKLPEKLNGLKEVLLSLYELSKKHEISILALALNFAIYNINIDKVVIGIESVQQFETNLNAISKTFPYSDILDELENIVIKEKKLLNPLNW